MDPSSLGSSTGKRNITARLIRVPIALLILVSLSACASQGNQTSDLDLPLPNPTAEATSQPLFATHVSPGDFSSERYEEPLRFTFPTSAPPPVTVWRPPLYETPWALNPNDHFYFSRPIAVDEVNWPLPNYRYGDFFPDTDIVHTGIDIDAERGTPVLAAGEGRVVWAGYGLYLGGNDPDDPYGLAVAVQHSFGYQGRILYTIYAHMDRIDVTLDQMVTTGDPLGIVGNTGNTTGPHLHFEVRVETNSFFVTRNPELWLAPPQGWGVLVGKITYPGGQPIRKVDVKVRASDGSQTWMVRTYGPTSVNSDDYYQENLALSDLPAGSYEVSFRVGWKQYSTQVEILPGATTYFRFNRADGFSFQIPAENRPETGFQYHPVDESSP